MSWLFPFWKCNVNHTFVELYEIQIDTQGKKDYYLICLLHVLSAGQVSWSMFGTPVQSSVAKSRRSLWYSSGQLP